MPTLSDIIIYPLKSAGGIHLDTCGVKETGLAFDREWMLVDKNHHFLSQRQQPSMALIRPKISEKELIFEAPQMPSCAVPLEQHTSDRVAVQIWEDRCHAQRVSPEADEWFSDYLGFPCQLVRMPPQPDRQIDPKYNPNGQMVNFSDGFPILVISEASLNYLNQQLAQPLPMDRFRPNLVVKGTVAFEEDEWAGFSLNRMDFDIKKPCARCVMTTIDQETGEKGKEPLATLATFRKSGAKILFGQNVMPRQTGAVSLNSQLAPWLPS